ncbi:hypothetical protein [Streptomyces sp. DSM 40750]|uniref:hypothetical protein n=1 Tax=Streptomyces sp. DSM 40750 TaxID=2801030 RepID=UPI00214B6B60|nr:hypothetical protein [Streptomyces sp. DSM 40750]UUU25747.1 hypothetical protein JIX55_38890 [Streptomyces sp. DSM 40750]
MTTSASSPVPAPRPAPTPGPANSDWPARLAAALSAKPDRIVLPHHSPVGQQAPYSYPMENDAIVLLPTTAVVVQLLPAEEGRVLGHYAAYHWHHEHGTVRTVVPNPLARVRHKQSVLYSKLGRRIGTQGIVVHYDDVDVTAVEREPGHPLVPLSGLEAWLANLPSGRRPTVRPEELRRRLHSRRTQSWPENGYRHGPVLTYQDTWVVHEGVHVDPAGREHRVALVIGPNDTKTRYGARRDHDVAHLSASGPVLAPFTVENGTRLVVPLPLPPGPDLGARLHTGLTTSEALRHALALLRTIADCHARYVVHQAIRPELVFPDEGGRTVTLIGAAYARIGGQGGGTDLLRSAVRDVHVAPEIREGAPRTVPQAADLWSWATVTVALLLGPGAGDHPPADLARLPADVPDVWRRALEHSLGSQGERPTASALLAVLDGSSAVAPTAARESAGSTAPLLPPQAGGTEPSSARPAPVAVSARTRGARLYQLGPYQTEQERKVAHTLAKGLGPSDAVIVAARADRRGRATDVDCVVLRGDVLIAVECKNWRLPDGLDPTAGTWPPGPGVTRAYTNHSPLPLLKQLAPALKQQIGWPGRTACLLVVPQVPALADPGSEAAAALVSQNPADLLGRVREIAPGDHRPPEFADCLRRLVGEIATPPVLSGFRLEAPHALGDGWQAFRAEANGLPHYLKIIGENMTTLPRAEATRLRRALSGRINEVARRLSTRPELAHRVFRPVDLPRDTSQVEPHLLIAYVWEHDDPVRGLPVPLPTARAAEVIAGLGAAVADLHAGDVILRDLSPDSAYRCTPPPGAPSGEPYYKVSMLEWMRVPQASTASVSQLFSRFPSPYVAPEIRDGDTRRVPACDLYSLAAVAHWLLTGEDPPYHSATDQVPDILAAHGVPRPLIDLLSSALLPSAARPAWTAQEFSARLSAAADFSNPAPTREQDS